MTFAGRPRFWNIFFPEQDSPSLVLPPLLPLASPNRKANKSSDISVGPRVNEIFMHLKSLVASLMRSLVGPMLLSEPASLSDQTEALIFMEKTIGGIFQIDCTICGWSSDLRQLATTSTIGANDLWQTILRERTICGVPFAALYHFFSPLPHEH